MKRVLVYEHARIDYLGGTLEQFIARLKEEFEAAVPEEFWGTAHLDLTTRYGEYSHSDKEYATIAVGWSRPETPEEESIRLMNEKENERRRREQYEQLKKEFGE